MTEIPEHLLKRSKERRAAIGGEDASGSSGEEAAPGEGSAAEPAAATPATTPAPAAPAEAALPVAPEPEPMRPEVAAYHSRRRIPYWAMPVLAFLPLWAYMYQATLEPPPAGEETPLVLGEEAYTANACSGCHGASGGGGSGPPLTGVLETWPDAADQVAWVRLGTQGWPGDTYGANEKPLGGGGVMPSHADLTDEEIAAVVLYERVQFGGSTEEDEADLVAVVEGEKEITELGVGEEMDKAGLKEDVLASASAG